jgi:hypothetical protein
MATRELVLQVAGALALAYALYPFVYSRFDNVPNTGARLQDNAAEAIHDGLMTFATLFTAFQAGVGYLVFRMIFSFLPDTMFAEK